jgi:hypothetical protein
VIQFEQNNYFLKRQILKLAGGAFRIYDSQERLVLYSRQKAFKLKEDIRLYADEEMTEELIHIQARSIVDFSAAYDVIDSGTGQHIGSFRRKGWESMFRDLWTIHDTDENEVGHIQEDSGLLAFLRRFLANLIPQEYDGIIADQHFCHYKQTFNPFAYRLHIEFVEAANLFERIMGIAGSVLLAAIEGKQD